MKRLFTLLLALGFGLSLSAQVFFNEDFESGSLPIGWTVVTAATDGGWIVGNAGDLSSSSFPIPDNGGLFAASNDDGCNCNKSEDILRTPAIDLTLAPADLVLVFDAFFLDETYQGVSENAQVVYSLDNGTTWQILLELGGSTAWQQGIQVDLGSLAGNSSVALGFRFSDNGGWLYGFAVDNILVYKPYDYDVKLTLNPVNRYNLLNSNITFSGTIANNGLQNITSLDINWTDGTNTYTDNLTGLNIAPGGTYNFNHSTQLEVANAVTYDVEVSATNPNGQPDGFDANNYGSAKVSGLSFVPSRVMVGEEATGTWCGWCPRGFVYMEQMDDDHADFIGIAVHNGDPMTNATYDDGLTSFPGFTGFPSVIVDRAAIVDPSEMEDYYTSTANRIVPVSAEITDALVDEGTRELTVNVAATFATQLTSDDYRFNVVLVESGIAGTGSSYNQANYYSFQANNIPLSGYYGFDWQALPNPVPAAQMTYDIVGRDILGGWDGWAGTQSVSADDVVTGSYTYTLPAAWNYQNMFVVFMVLDGNTGEILNAAEREIWTLGNTEIDNLQRFVLSPNPTNGYATLDLQLEKAADVRVEVLNTIGQTLNIQQADNSFGGLFQFNLENQAAGTYFVKVSVGDQVRVERLVIAK